MSTAAREETKGAESSGEGWRIFVETVKGKPVYVLAVNVDVGVRRKHRIDGSKYDTIDKRRSYAISAASELRKMYAEELAAKKVEEAKSAAKPSPTKLTFKEVGEMWTSGDLAKSYPDHVKTKKTADDDVSRL